MKTALLICLVVVCGVHSAPAGKSSGAYYGGQAGPAGQQYFNQAADGSYSYGYNTGTGAYRAEQKTGSHVSGTYGQTGPDGSFVNVEYQAVSTGESGPRGGQYVPGVAVGRVAPAAPPVAVGYGAGAVPKPAHYSSGARLAQTAAVAPVPSGPSRPAEYAAFNLERGPDGSYSYSYSSSDSSKTESGTADGQVEGSFRFRGDDGVERTVGYSAGQQGFLASGAHFPTADDGTPPAGTSAGGGFPVAPSGASAQQRYAGRSRYQAGGYQYSGHRQYVAPQKFAGGAAAYQHGGAGVGYGRYTGAVNESPKPFAFTYSAGDHGRQESQDASGTVRGSYVVNTADGTQKEVTYQADDSGFHVLSEKQVESGSGGAAVYPATGGAARVSYGSGYQSAGLAYKPKSIHAGAPAYG